MKRLLFISFLLLGIGQTPLFAQNDDIYFNSSDLEQQKKEDRDNEREAREAEQRYQNEYSSDRQDDNGNYQTYNKSYDNDGYIDYDNDDYQYATRFRRFNQPFYNMGYYSMFYNPYWYDPFWADPYWGWSPWNRPTMSIMIGGGPYWSSYWGWHNWYGYGGFGSCWGYPMYGNWFGSPFYSGYWNGYYAGIYGGGGFYGGGAGSRRITYGPRNSTNFAYNTGLRGTAGAVRREATGQRPGLRTAQVMTNSGMTERSGRTMNNSANPQRAVGAERTRTGQQRMEAERYGNSRTPVNERSNSVNSERPGRGQFSREEATPRYNQNNGVNRNERPAEGNRMQERNDRPAYENNRMQERQPRQQMQQRSYEQPRQQRSFEQRSAPSYERQRSAPSFERQRSTPSYTPSRSMPSAPSRSVSPGGGGGNFGGGRRR